MHGLVEYNQVPYFQDAWLSDGPTNIQVVPTDSLSEMDCFPCSTDLTNLTANIGAANNFSSEANGDFHCEPFEHKDSFKTKPVKQWDSNEVLAWINHEAQAMGVFCTDINGTKFCKLDGYKLLGMSEQDFENCDQNYGKKLFARFENLVANQSMSKAVAPTYTNLETVKKKPVNPKSILDDTNNNSPPSTTDERRKYPVKSLKCVPSNEVPMCTEVKKTKKNKPGRPKLQRKKNKQDKKLGRLWEFIRDLLKDPRYCPGLIRWEDHDKGLFRFVHSDKVAQLWGSKKSNSLMNYEKLSRAMRYYYKSGVLQAVVGRRLVYAFGPNAKNWRVENPNFEN